MYIYILVRTDTNIEPAQHHATVTFFDSLYPKTKSDKKNSGPVLDSEMQTLPRLSKIAFLSKRCAKFCNVYNENPILLHFFV